MSITCPACNKPNQAQPACSRCGCDLSCLLALANGAAGALSQARNWLHQRDWAEALEWAEESWRLRHTAEAAGIAFLAAGALGLTARALCWHERLPRTLFTSSA